MTDCLLFQYIVYVSVDYFDIDMWGGVSINHGMWINLWDMELFFFSK